jgi:drug/metabolite transporter (DMT)-like permease
MALAADKAAGVAKEGTPLVAGPEGLAHRRKRVLGLLLAVLSALIASIDPLLTRFVRLNTETDAAVIAWKYLAVGSILIVFVHVTSDDTPIGLIRKLHASKAYLHLGRAALLMALHNLLWTMAVLETSIGHAIAIAALAPLWSVLIEWRMFGDRVSACTVFSVVLTTSAVAMLFLNDPGGPIPGGQGKHVSGASALVSVQHVQHVLTTIAEPTELHGDETSRPPSLRGDLYALLSGFCMAAYLGACRWTDRMCPSAPMTLSPALGSLLVCFVAGVWAIVTKPTTSDPTVPWVPLLTISICLGFLEALEDVSMVFATRHIPATHVAMLMNLDVIVGPLLAVAAFGEYPTMLTVVVCIIVITVLICHTAVYETGFLDDRPTSDLFRFPLCVRAVKVRHGERDTKSGGIAPEVVTAATSSFRI